MLLTACGWNRSASFWFSESWDEKGCDKAKIFELRKEYNAKVAEPLFPRCKAAF
jgi:hypothetical protein